MNQYVCYIYMMYISAIYNEVYICYIHEVYVCYMYIRSIYLLLYIVSISIYI